MIFVVEDEEVLRRSVAEFLAGAGNTVEGFGSAEAALTAARNAPPDLVVSDLQLPGMGGLELLAELGKLDPGMVRIAVTAHSSTKSVLTAMRMGCYEYLEKPLDLQQLARLVARALGERRAGTELDWHRRRTKPAGSADGFLGESSAMADLRRTIERLAAVRSGAPPTLVTGETGVGKGVVARALHDARFGPGAPWIEVNCAALPAALVEAELFGHERSAFTDAREAKPGLFEAASGGTIFLDEVGELPLEAQAKLLKVVESGAVRRLGGIRERATTATIVAATNVDLVSASAAGRFREDLLHRLAALTIAVPPLRERGGDAVALARAFLAEGAHKFRKPLRGLSGAAEAAIRSHRWPGNIRELKFAIERAVVLARDDAQALDAADLQLTAPVGGRTSAAAAAGLTFAPDGGIDVRLPTEGVVLDEVEKAILAAALTQTGGNVVQAARLLGLNRDALRYRIRKFGLEGTG